MLRRHQQEMKAIIDGIRAGSGVTDILASVTPGGGKSLLPVIAGGLVSAGLADAICWICPRTALTDQGERGFLDPFFRKMLGHRLSVRSSTNEIDPCRGTNGFVTTYQAAVADHANGGLLWREFAAKRYILILDEFHHCEAGGVWAKAIQPLYDLAAFRVLMTGTLERGDGKPIAFTRYDEQDDGMVPVMVPDDKTAVIRYARSDALKERSIIPLEFIFHDGQAEWIDKDNIEHSAKSIASLKKKKDASEALFTALSTDYAEGMLCCAIEHWHKHRQRHPGALALAVTANKEHADRALKLLKPTGLRSEIATSHDSRQALDAIKRFKSGEIDILVTIAMAYEGLDVPAISHIVCLTHIRSTPWIEQMIARAVRIDRNGGPYRSQRGYIFTPDDILMRNVVERIRSEQIPFVKDSSEPVGTPEQIEMFDGGGNGGAPKICPLGSLLTGNRTLSFGEHGSGQQGLFDFQPQNVARIVTPKEREKQLRDEIERHVRDFSFFNYLQNGQLNAEIKAAFHGKSRADMTLEELESVKSYINWKYPLTQYRGRRRRVPTKAVPFDLEKGVAIG